jgi:hypothetical protein
MVGRAAPQRAMRLGYFLFAGRAAWFSGKAANIQRSLDAELYFYAIEVFRTGLTF